MVRIIAEVTLFPFTLGYLLLYAAWIHARRKVRMALRGEGWGRVANRHI